jgi:type I restriction-modification system DNA methylase subunit
LEIENEKNEEILKVYKAMRELLVHDLEPKAFADMYAQTLVYGLFVARYYDETPENFTRSEARDLIPASNPFLQHFFDHIAGASFDKRLGYIVDELCDVFSVSDVNTIVNKHYKITDNGNDKDPIIHFYEDFLKEYDPALKKKMGAYYTPVPVVHFMIRAVDEILKKDFSLKQGVADTSTVEVKMMQQGTKAKKTIHRVQVLDPAVGTATFLNETIKLIYSKFKGQEGRWESYVERELLPRLHGFELMMAPYTIAHLKLAMTLKETGINQFKKRLSVYLTNSLEEGINLHEDWFSLGFADAINEESRAASVIKKETPIMVVLGNPPYFGESNNKSYKGQDIYKLEPTGGKLKEIKLTISKPCFQRR